MKPSHRLGKPCKYGHPGIRYVLNGSCVTCASIKNKAEWRRRRDDPVDIELRKERMAKHTELNRVRMQQHREIADQAYEAELARVTKGIRDMFKRSPADEKLVRTAAAIVLRAYRH